MSGVSTLQRILETSGIDALDAQPITSGLSGTAIWRVQTADGPLAVRSFTPGQLATWQREQTALEAALDAGLPVPKVHASAAVAASPYLITDWLSGQPLTRYLLRHPWEAEKLGRQMGELQARLHRIVVEKRKRVIFGDWRRWPLDLSPETRQLLDQLDLQPDRLLHLDFHPDNLLVDDGRISGIIDWSNAKAGDPRADLARTLLLLAYGPRLFGWRYLLARPVIRRLIAGWQAGYWEAAGRQRNLGPFLLWAAEDTLADLQLKLTMDELSFNRRALLGLLADLDQDLQQWRARVG